MFFALKSCQFFGFVTMKNARMIRQYRSESVAIVLPPAYVALLPKSSPTVVGSSLMTAPSMNGCILQTNA